MATLSSPRRGWTAVHYSTCDDALVSRVAQLATVPGVYWYETDQGGVIEVPQSVWPLPLWQECLDYLDASPPSPRTSPLVEPLATSLYPHQREGAQWLVQNRGGLLADQMGLGKTRTAICAAETLALHNGPDRPRLIVAPSYTRDTWRRELEAAGVVTAEDDFFALRTRDSRAGARASARWWFVHYEIVQAWASRIQLARPIVAIVDEAHWIKHGRAGRSQGAAAAAGVAETRILLTGTPLANRPAELWHPLTLLDGRGSWGSPLDFRKRYCGAVYEGYGHVDTGPTRTDELRCRLTDRYLRRTVDDVGIALPSLTRQALVLDLDPTDAASHAEIVGGSHGLERLLAALRAGGLGEQTLRVMARLRALTSSAKLRTTADYVRSLHAQDEATVVFAWERRTVEKLATLSKVPHVVIHGGVPQAERDARVAAFQCADEPLALFATLDSLKEGVTLHRARSVILHDQSWVPSDVLQAEARVHRIGQGRPCVSTWVLCRDSFDTILASTLADKGDVIDATLGVGAARHAAAELDLRRYGLPAIEDEAARLLAVWESSQKEAP